jgi:hypothetical protein
MLLTLLAPSLKFLSGAKLTVKSKLLLLLQTCVAGPPAPAKAGALPPGSACSVIPGSAMKAITTPAQLPVDHDRSAESKLKGAAEGERVGEERPLMNTCALRYKPGGGRQTNAAAS